MNLIKKYNNTDKALEITIGKKLSLRFKNLSIEIKRPVMMFNEEQLKLGLLLTTIISEEDDTITVLKLVKERNLKPIIRLKEINNFRIKKIMSMEYILYYDSCAIEITLKGDLL